MHRGDRGRERDRAGAAERFAAEGARGVVGFADWLLIPPHPRVGASFLRKATDYDARLSRTRDRLRQMH